MTDTTDDTERSAADHASTSTDERSQSETGHDAHGGEALGPVDVQAWGALLLGAGLGLVVAICVGLSISG